ncbi:hypothetical protein [Roseomonas chloroacetimidivorans]|uniref:hypothetical protein n=1 Tax=Roseomonas chloroacetimidivorans TaxID=1766656 RepID=UPI003C754A1D
MDDDLPSQGMSGWAGYALGRMSAESDQVMDEFARTLNRRFRPQAPTVDVNALLAENQALRQQLKATQSALTDYEFNYAELKKWAREAEAKLREAGLLLD